MERIKTFEDLKALPYGTEIIKIVNGECERFSIVGIFNPANGINVRELDGDRKPRTLYKGDFKISVFTTDMDSPAIGEIMLAQLEEIYAKKVENVKKALKKFTI